MTRAKPSPPKPLRLILPVCGTCWTEIRHCTSYCRHGGWMHRDSEKHACGQKWPGSYAQPASDEEVAEYRQKQREALPVAAAV
jgi:hypothetical protein